MRTRSMRIILLALCLFARLSFAQDAKMPVSVDQSGEDSVGQRLTFSLREAIRASTGYRLASRDDAVMHISLITIDPEQSGAKAGYWTTASVIFTMTNYLPYKKSNPQTWYPIYLTSLVVVAGTQRVEDQAKGILAAFDDAVEKYKLAAKGAN